MLILYEKVNPCLCRYIVHILKLFYVLQMIRPQWLHQADAIGKSSWPLPNVVCAYLLVIFSSDRCSITYPWLVLLWLLFFYFFLCSFNFSQERLGIIHCTFSDMFSILLLNDSQSLNTFEILVWDIFAFFASEFVDLAAKRALIGEISNENQIT